MDAGWLTTTEAAELLHVSGDTLKRWHRLGLLAGRLEPDRTAGGHWRWPAGPVRRLAAAGDLAAAVEIEHKGRA